VPLLRSLLFRLHETIIVVARIVCASIAAGDQPFRASVDVTPIGAGIFDPGIVALSRFFQF